MATTSNHLRGTSELMLVASIKNGFVDHPSRLVSYATRLGQLLEVLLEGRRAATEVDLLPGSGPLERLDTIFSTQWAIRQRPQRAELIVSAVFDSSWEAYMRSLQKNTGELLDAIFCHCEGYENHTCVKHGYEAFSAWLRDHQVQTRFFHSSMPDLTVSDLRGLRRFVAGDSDTRVAIPSVEQAEALVRSAWPKPDVAGLQARAVESEHALQSMAALAESFSEMQWVKNGPTERETYLAGIQALIETSTDASLRQRAQALGLFSERPPAAKKRVDAEPIPAPDPTNIQYNILRTYNDGASWDTKIKHGCLVMLECDDAQSVARLLQALLPHISTDAKPAERQINVALTNAGMTRLELGEATLALLPPEFRQGMDKRAGLLGDVGPQAHPSNWERLPLNWPEPSERTASLSGVDVVLLVQRAVVEEKWTPNDHVFDPAHPLYGDLRELDLELELEKNGVHILHVQALRRYPSDHFRLGEENQAASQPKPPWPPGVEPEESKHNVPLGEVLLGHRNRHGGVAQWAIDPKGKWLFENGTFLVVRKLQQDVPAFQSYIQRCVRELGVSSPHVNGWILGRYPADGRTLVAPGAPDPENEFDYSSPEASYCPLHSHVRRANPRLADTPRILRRSFPYGSEYDDEAPEDTERGLVFMAYNASIAEQFEVIQRWLNGGNATGLPSVVNDLIAGVPQAAGAQRWAPGSGIHKLPPPERPFVSLRWGLYLFVPSMAALREMARRATAPAPAPRYTDQAAAKRATKKAKAVRQPAAEAPARRAKRPAAPLEPAAPRAPGADAALDKMHDEGFRTIRDIFDIEDIARQREAWKEVLEEPIRTEDAGAVWAAIRNPSLPMQLAKDFPKYSQSFLGSPAGTLPTPYGLLVSSHAHAREIFADDGKRFSVEEYGQRLDATIGGHYLGIDRKDDRYEQLSQHANEYLTALEPLRVYARANQAASAALANAKPSGPGLPPSVDLVDLALIGIGGVAAEFLFTPEHCGDDLPTFVKPFIPVSRYCFQPYPDAKLQAQAEGVRQLLAPDGKVARMPGPFANHLRKKVAGTRGIYADERWVRSAVVGAMVGFAPPAVAHVVGIVMRWLASGEIERHSRKNRDARMRAVIRAMTEVPVPPTIYRKLMPGARLDDRELLRLVEPFRTKYVVVGTQSVTLDAIQQRPAASAAGKETEWQWLFAGDRTNTSLAGNGAKRLPAVHGCPARYAAVAAVLGIIDAISAYPNARLCGPLGIIVGPFAPPAKESS